MLDSLSHRLVAATIIGIVGMWILAFISADLELRNLDRFQGSHPMAKWLYAASLFFGTVGFVAGSLTIIPFLDWLFPKDNKLRIVIGIGCLPVGMVMVVLSFFLWLFLVRGMALTLLG